MNQIRLGRSNLRVSRIAFGAWELGGDWGATDQSAAIATIRHAADQGINFFDTAQGYGRLDVSAARLGLTSDAGATVAR